MRPDCETLLSRLLPYRSLSDFLACVLETWGMVFDWDHGNVRCSLANSPLTLELAWQRGSTVIRRSVLNDQPSGGDMNDPFLMLFEGDDGVCEFRYPQDFAQTTIPLSFLEGTRRLVSQAIGEECRLTERKLEALAEFAAGAGHEVNNPLGSIVGRVDQLLPGETDPERRRLLQTIGGQVYRIRDMIGDTMLFARPPAPVPVWNNACETFLEVHSRMLDQLAAKSLTAQISIPDELKIWADPVQLRIVWSELLRNAIQASPAGAVVQVSAKSGHSNGQWGISSTIENVGAPLSELEIEHCFDPFYSGRQAGRGLGFGLSKCWRILELHAGTIRFTTSPEATCFECWFPMPVECGIEQSSAPKS